MRTFLQIMLLTLVSSPIVKAADLTESSVRPAAFAPCGDSGSLQQKMSDCAARNPESAQIVIAAKHGDAYGWSLVSNQAGLGEVWMDQATGLAWSPKLATEMTYEAALNACAAWDGGASLPSADDYEQAEIHGLRKVMKDFSKRLYWTASESDYPTAAFFYNGSDGYVDDGNRAVVRSVRCTQK